MPASTAEGRKCGTLGGVEPEGVEELTRRARLVKLGDHTLSPQQQGIRVLGAPIKSAEYVQSQLEQKQSNVKNIAATHQHMFRISQRDICCVAVFSPLKGANWPGCCPTCRCPEVVWGSIAVPVHRGSPLEGNQPKYGPLKDCAAKKQGLVMSARRVLTDTPPRPDLQAEPTEPKAWQQP